MIFSDITRDDASPKRHSESSFEWLDRSARDSVDRVRRELEAWVTRYPEDGRDVLTSGIRSSRDSQHEGAMFELFLHELLVRLGCSVEVHPEMSDSPNSPDFLVDGPKGHRFILEATVASDSPDPAAERRMATVRDTLDRVRAEEFFLDLTYDGLPSGPIPGRRLRDRIERDLAQADVSELRNFAEQGEWGRMPSWDFEFPGVSIEVTAFPTNRGPRDLESTRAVGTTMPGVAFLTTHETISTAVRRKAGRYGAPPYPYVVAVNVLGDFPPDNIDIFDALLGKEALEVGITEDGTRVQREIRQPNGIWRGPRGIQNQRVSAVLLGRGTRPWTLESAPLELFLNPWANRAYDCELTELDRWVLGEDDAFHRQEGQSIRELFDLPAAWPYE